MLNISFKQIYKLLNAMVLQKVSWFFSRVGEKQLFYFFERWNRALEKK